MNNTTLMTYLSRTILGLLAVSLTASPALAAPSPTPTTTLTVSAGSVTSGTPVLLTATVVASGSPLSPGQVNFCDATAASCQGPALLGTAQLTSTGTASTSIVFGLGTHQVKAVYLGTTALLSGASTTSTVTVTGKASSITAISPSGSAGSYTLNAIIGYNGIVVPGTGETVSFTDTTNSNYALGSSPLTGLTAPLYNFMSTVAPVVTGSLPLRVVAADLNGDGIPDMVTANLAENTVSVYFGTGSGAFTQASGSPYPVSSKPQALAIGDFNNDGFPDVAVASVGAGPGTVTILLGSANGHLAQGATVTVGTSPQAIAVADFNSDGILDLAVANVLSSNVSLMMGDGTGNFTAASSSPISTGSNPSALVTADFNSDGLPDLAVVNTSDNTVTVLLGAGSSTLTPMTGSPFAVPVYPVAIAAGDVNGDGKPDLAVISGTQNNVRLLINSGSTFTAGSSYPTGSSPSAISVGDFNGDGKQDLLTANANDSTATLLLGAGDGTFTVSSQSPLTAFDGPSAMAIADFNGDGRSDVAIANAGVSSVSVRLLQVTQTATASLTPVSIPGNDTHQIVASYAGDANYAASTSGSISLTASSISTSTTLFVSPATTVPYLQTMQLTATIKPALTANFTMQGTATFSDGGKVLGTATVTNSQAVLTSPVLAVGAHQLTVSYSGDSNFAGSSTPAATPVTIQKANTTTTLVTSNATVVSGNTVIFTATVLPATSGTATGTVMFYSSLSTAALGQASLNSGGVATFSTNTLATGGQNITAVYSGDSNYAASTSIGVAEALVDFTIMSSSPSQTVIPGHSVTFPLTITPNGAFTSPLTLTATGLPPTATVSFSPATVTLTGSATAVTMTVTTQLNASSLQRNSTNNTRTLAYLFGFALLPLAAAKRVRRLKLNAHWTLGLLAFIALLTAAGLTGCSTGNGLLQNPPSNYVINVTATGGNVSHATAVTLNVQ